MVLKTKGLSFILITLLAAGCGGSVELPDAEEAAPAPLGEAFELRLDQTQQVEELAIRFVDVTEDSRCPPIVRCVWQGQVTIQLDVTKHGVDAGSFSLSTHFDAVANLDGYDINLTEVLPGPAPAGESIPTADYIITLVVRR